MRKKKHTKSAYDTPTNDEKLRHIREWEQERFQGFVNAIETDDFSALSALLKQWPDLRRKALIFAIEKDNGGAINRMLERGVNPNTPDENNGTPLLYAISLGRKNAVEALLKASNIDIEARDDDGRTALMYAAEMGYANIINALVAKGADVNIRDNDKLTALIYAASYLNRDALYNHPENFVMQKKNGNLLTSKNEAVKALLNASDIDVNAQDKWGGSALMYAVYTRNISAVLTLLKTPAINLGLRDTDENTAHDMAIEQQAQEAALAASNFNYPQPSTLIASWIADSLDTQNSQVSRPSNTAHNNAVTTTIPAAWTPVAIAEEYRPTTVYNDSPFAGDRELQPPAALVHIVEEASIPTVVATPAPLATEATERRDQNNQGGRWTGFIRRASNAASSAANNIFSGNQGSGSGGGSHRGRG